MAEFEKIGKVIDAKLKAVTTAKQAGEKMSALEQLAMEENDLFTKLGRTVFENEKANEESQYKELVQEIICKQQLISEELQKRAGKTCTKCGAPVSDTALFCTACGQKIEEVPEMMSITCPTCGGKIKAEAKFCVHCGTKL